MTEPNRQIKDRIFTFMFKQPEYTKALYLQLHPEDTDVKEEDFKLVTLENVMVIGQYNDLGIQVRDKLIFLVEAQSTFSENIPLRMLMYLASTYKEYVTEHKLSLYREKPVSIPKPELYVVYTGDKQDVPDTLKLSDLYGGDGSAEITVKVLVDDGSGDILDQYIEFSKIFDKQAKTYGHNKRALDEAIKISTERGVLKSFLESRQKEVGDIMTTLFNQQQVLDIELYNIAQECREEGIQEGMEKTQTALIKQMLNHFSLEDIARFTNIPLDEVKRLAEE